MYEIELKQIVAPKVETPLDPTGLANQKRTIIYAAGREIWPARVAFEKTINTSIKKTQLFLLCLLLSELRLWVMVGGWMINQRKR